MTRRHRKRARANRRRPSPAPPRSLSGSRPRSPSESRSPSGSSSPSSSAAPSSSFGRPRSTTLLLLTLVLASASSTCGGLPTPRSAAPPLAASPPPPTPPTPPPPPRLPTKRWLRGSTHVHAKPSGDSTTEISDVIAWYERHGYDFIALTDHNRVSEVTLGAHTDGEVAVHAPQRGLLVLAGIELTHNPAQCLPAPSPPLPCRIHVNALGVTARPQGRLEWAERQSQKRLDQYTRALETAHRLGGLAQLNHPQWHWGVSPELLVELARRGAALLEIANVQFTSWNAGDGEHLSTEALWDAALSAGVTLWGVATDDAHSYDGAGKYPAGGGWVMVRSEREPRAIVAALAAGDFYSSTGVTLARADVEGGDLVVEVAAESPGAHRIAFVANGATLAEHPGPIARHGVPQHGYVRAVVTRADGAKAWVQPARR